MPLLLVYVRDVGLAVHVLAVRGGAWAYHEGRAGVLASCADVGTAAEVVGLRLKRRMFPGTW